FLPKIYDQMMSHLNYKNWADYIYKIYRYYKIKNKSVLELACGTGKLSRFLAKKFDEYLISDISLNMLKSCDNDLQKVCLDMRKIPFKNKFGFIFCTFDSINYLLTSKELNEFFQEIFNIMDKESILTFDAAMEPTAVQYEGMNNTEKRFGDIFVKQISNYNKETKIITNHFIIKNDSETDEEIHRQKIFDIVDYFKIIEECGLCVDKCYECPSFEIAEYDSPRVQLIIKKV
ncbi:MAG: class I SAM-dependent methyltransferase, partial [Ignavibacteriales bacterium]|nr:class I SAM-dependent methyltransferase [Ignavibacteriales bacterium]